MLSLIVYVLFRATMNMNMGYTPARSNGDIHYDILNNKPILKLCTIIV